MKNPARLQPYSQPSVFEFRSPDFQEIREKLKFPAIFDVLNIYDPQAVASAGLIHYSIGRRPTNRA